MSFFSSKTILLLICSLVCFHGGAETYSPPDNKTHSAFLLSDWQPNKPSLMVFTDPHCPYCIKALKKRERLSNYNIYLFWAPILGNASYHAVKQFFSCDSPTSPNIIKSVIDRKPPLCTGTENHDLRSLNDLMVQQYAPNSVPQYWYGGRRVSLSQLNLVPSIEQQIQLIAKNSKLKIKWERYQSKAVATGNIALTNIGLVMPRNTNISGELLDLMRQDTSLNWYIFQNSTPYSKENIEFRILTNLTHNTKPTFVLEGKVLSNEEVNAVVNKNLISLLPAS
ncbi:MAG: thiol-disulfide isomerase/thioredoxin [Paraglaciecola sp.]|jgi:thiol-disulfide isomerase/thioredoxin